MLQATETPLPGEEQGQHVLGYVLDFATRGENMLPLHKGERGSTLLIVECAGSRVAIGLVYADESCGNSSVLLSGRRDADGAAVIGVPFEDGESQSRGQRPTAGRNGVGREGSCRMSG